MCPTRSRLFVCVFILAHLSVSLCPVSAQAHLACQNCFYGSEYCDPNTSRCIYGCRDGWKGDKCLQQCITKGCKQCEDKSSGIEHCTSCLHPGYYGELCNQQCRTNCKRYNGEDACDHFGNCIYGCVGLYIGDKCDQQNCPFDNCRQCDLMYNKHVYCYQCISGYYWIPTVEKCVECSKNCRDGIPDCDPLTGFCKSGQCSDGWMGRNCNIPCDVIEQCSACKEINGKVECVTCNENFFPNLSTNRTTCSSCIMKCGSNDCDRQTGVCSNGCEFDVYGNSRELQCTLDNCDVCAIPCKQVSALCTKCKNGYYSATGGGCQLCPVDCHTDPINTCQFTQGRCLNGCKDGWFGHRCERACPIHCLHCEDYINGVCGQCEAGWYGLACESTCNSNCKPNGFSGYVYCHKETGTCQEGCNPGWYGADCSKMCSHSCVTSNCVRETGECPIGCAINKFGKFCNQSCSINCKDSTSSIDSVCNWTDGACVYGCSMRYYGDHCNLTCSHNCFGSVCDVITGDCHQGCKLGYTGKKCDQQCTSTCPTACGRNCLYDQCDAITNTCTAGCHTGWYGAQCEKICSDKCLNRICDQNRGNCQDGCVEPYYGIRCDNQCQRTCQSTKCEQLTGTCEACDDGYYGPDCRLTCPTQCSNSTCDKQSGHCFRCGIGRHGDFCMQDCIPGYHGDNCESMCGHCKDGSPCHIVDGACPSGCDIGWTGPSCMEAFQSSGEKTSDSNKVMQIAIGCVVGGVVCCLVIVTVVCWYKRKHALSKKVEEPSVHFRDAQVVINPVQQTESRELVVASGDQTSNQSMASGHSLSDPLLGDPQGSQIKLLDVIRQGRFYSLVKGEVIKHGTTEQCCVKLLKLKECKDEKYVYRLTLESEILAQCGSHKNIISLIKTYQNSEIYCVAIDNCLQTGLLYYLRRLPSVTNENGFMSLDPVNIYKITQFVTEICSAVSYMHDLKIIHRALRAGHVYLSRNHVTKLGDFDWAEWYRTDRDAASHWSDLPKNYYHWMSPESCISNAFSYESDMWSLGMLFWEVFNLARKVPYSGLSTDDHKQAVKDGIRPSKPPLVHFSLYRLMKSCWRYDPADRPKSEHVLSQLQMIQASSLATVQQL